MMYLDRPDLLRSLISASSSSKRSGAIGVQRERDMVG